MTVTAIDQQVLLNDIVREIERVEYRSHDPYDILGSGPIVAFRRRRSSGLNAITNKTPTPRDRLIRKLVGPIYQSGATMSLYRRLFGIPKLQHPKTMGLMLQTYVSMYRKFRCDQQLDRAKQCAKWLMEHTDYLHFGYYCWGFPWQWPSEVTIPKHGPQSTLSAFNGLGFIDLYEVTNDPKYLEVAVSIGNFLLNCLNLDKVTLDRWAFSYTPYDKTHIINVNFHCAALLVRAWKHCEDDRFLTTALNVCNFSVAEQRPDGAWHYSAGCDGFVNAVDNTHTGDNLEYLAVIRETLEDKFIYEGALRSGIEYYLDHFMDSSGMPRYTDTDSFPGEGHSAGQMLITLAAISPLTPRAQPMAAKLLRWITQYMMNDRKNRMYYRLYESGRADRSYSIAAADAWLAKGLARWTELDQDISSLVRQGL